MPPHQTANFSQTARSQPSDETLRNGNTSSSTTKQTTSRERESKKCPLCMRSKPSSTSDGCVHAKALIQKTSLKAPFIGLHNSRLLDKCPTSSTKFPEFKALIEKTIDEFTKFVPANDFTIDKKPYREMLVKHFYQKINDLAIARGIFSRDSTWNDDGNVDDEIEIVNNTINSRIEPPNPIQVPPSQQQQLIQHSSNTTTRPNSIVKIKPASKPKPKPITTTPSQTPNRPSTIPTNNNNTQIPKPKSTNQCTNPILDVDSPTLTTPRITYLIKEEEKCPTPQSPNQISLNKSPSDDSFHKPSIVPTVSIKKTLTTPARRSSLPSSKKSPQKIQKQKIMLKNNRTKKRELMMLSESDFTSLQSLGEAFVQNHQDKPPLVDQIQFKYPENGKKIHVNTTGLEVIKELFGKYDLLEFSIGKKQRCLTTPNKV